MPSSRSACSSVRCVRVRECRRRERLISVVCDFQFTLLVVLHNNRHCLNVRVVLDAVLLMIFRSFRLKLSDRIRIHGLSGCIQIIHCIRELVKDRRIALGRCLCPGISLSAQLEREYVVFQQAVRRLPRAQLCASVRCVRVRERRRRERLVSVVRDFQVALLVVLSTTIVTVSTCVSYSMPSLLMILLRLQAQAL